MTFVEDYEVQIRVSELRLLTEILFTHLEELEKDEITISHDYYWAISDEERYNPYEKPSDLTIGQLTDDWQELQQILVSENEPISYALVWLSSILRCIGEDVVR